MTVFATLIFTGAFTASLYAIFATLLPALPRIAQVLRGAELAGPVTITEPRRSRVTMRIARPVQPEWRAAA
jgi:hypothetical protein